MPLKLWSPNEVLTSTDQNNLSKQVIITCTSGTRPSSPNEGMFIFETDTNMLRYWTGTAWRSVITSVPSVLLTKGAASVANNSVVSILWDAEQFDNYGMWTSGSTVTIPMAGFWMVGLDVTFAGQATVAGVRSAQIWVNSAAQNSIWLPTTSPGFNNTPLTLTLTHPMAMSTGDIIEAKVFHTAGASLNIQGPTRMWAHMVAEGT